MVVSPSANGLGMPEGGSTVASSGRSSGWTSARSVPAEAKALGSQPRTDPMDGETWWPSRPGATWLKRTTPDSASAVS